MNTHEEKLSWDEIAEMFGETIPLEAVVLIQNHKDGAKSLRVKLKEIALQAEAEHYEQLIKDLEENHIQWCHKWGEDYSCDTIYVTAANAIKKLTGTKR